MMIQLVVIRDQSDVSRRYMPLPAKSLDRPHDTDVLVLPTGS